MALLGWGRELANERATRLVPITFTEDALSIAIA